MSRQFKTYNPNPNDQLKEPMFFGQNVNVARYDQQRHAIFEKLIERQLSVFWRPEEVSVSQDSADFAKLPDNEKHIFISNLKYQILLDSIQGRGPNAILLPICSLPELETWIETWGFSETIHSRSYTHILRNVFTVPSVVFDDIVPNPQIAKRAKAVADLYDQLQGAVDSWRHHQGDLRAAKKALMICMASINILEGVRFFVSFACSFAFAERKIMEGNAKIIRLIARDEAIHLAGTQHIFRLWREGLDDPEMKEIWQECKHEVRQVSLEAAEQEKEWSEYLFQDGSMIGLNKKILDQYVEHITDQRLVALALEPEFGKPKNPIPWINTWLASDSVQVAPQETEISSYLTSAVDSTINEDDFSDMEL